MINAKDDFDKRIGKNIQRIRKEQGITQDELADRIGSIKQTISKIERGVYSPSAKVLYDICEAINISPNEIMHADTEYIAWREENVKKVSYSINGLADKINILEDFWAKADYCLNIGDEKGEIAALDTIIQACLKAPYGRNYYFRRYAEYLYKGMLNEYLEKSIQEVRGNKMNNLKIRKSDGSSKR